MSKLKSMMAKVSADCVGCKTFALKWPNRLEVRAGGYKYVQQNGRDRIYKYDGRGKIVKAL